MLCNWVTHHEFGCHLFHLLENYQNFYHLQWTNVSVEIKYRVKYGDKVGKNCDISQPEILTAY